MEKVRIGNDMMVNFSVYRNGQPESFDGASNIATKLVNEAYNKEITHSYTIAGNVVQFDIDALQLAQCGKCRLFISYTKGGDYTVDSPAFELVNYTDQTGGTEIIGVEIVSINISGDIGINRDGLSAYEVWKSYPGNEGKTIEEYFLWLRENPTKIDLDGLNSNIDKLHFKADTLVQLANIGDVRYSQESRTLEVKVSDTVSIQLGQEMQTRVKNDEAIQINNGQMVYINSAAGANPLAKLASTTNADIAQRAFGMATENIPANGFGAITTEGLVRDINTSAFQEGAMLWLGANGSVTNIEPTAPTSKISIGMVLRSNANNGVVYVKIRAIARNQKLSDVYAPTLTGGDILRWNSTTLRFEVFNITSALSNKVDPSRTITAGNGLTGGGSLTEDRTININPADDSLTVTADNIKVNTNNTLTSTSTTQPLSANQGKVLNEKVVQVETYLNGIAELVKYTGQWYGVEWDTTVSSSALTRIGNMSLHYLLPIQSKMRRCLLLDNGVVNYYLHPTDSTKKEDGTSAVLDGTDGQVMVEIPEFYYEFQSNLTKNRVLLSEYPILKNKSNKVYISAYEAALDRTNLKLSSVVNNTAQFRGGNNNAANDLLSKTLLGRPATSLSLTQFRTYARNRGSVNWNCNAYLAQKILYWLIAVEYGNFNNQLAYNPALTAEGYMQGGLGNGVTNISDAKWNSFNGYYPFIPCGHTNSLGNSTGIVPYQMPTEYDPVILTTNVPSYRGVENPFGHLWKWTDGCKCNIQSDASGGISEFYVCNDPANYQDVDFANYVLRGLLPRANGYIKSLIVGESGEMMPLTVGGSSTTYMSDYFYTSLPASGVAQRGVLFGGAAINGASAGVGCSDTYYAATTANAVFGSRLCYII